MIRANAFLAWQGALGCQQDAGPARSGTVKTGSTFVLLEGDLQMASRPSWHGYLRLSLVTCPVAMLPAISEAVKVRFLTLNRATGNRVRVCYVDAETGKPVDDEDQVK